MRPLLCIRGLLLAVVIAAVSPVAWAQTYPSDQWGYRTKVDFDNAVGTESLLDFPVLVRLSASNFDFGLASPDGSDIRFADPDDTALPYEIEKWDPASQEAILWVGVPQIDAASDADFMYMFHGNPAAADGQNPGGVWANGYKGVWHLDGSGAAFDSTGRQDGTVVGTGVTSAAGILGDGRAYDASNDHIVVAQHPELNAGDNISISYWMNGGTAQPGTYTRVLSKGGDGDTPPGWEYQRAGGSANQDLRIDTSGGFNQVDRIADNAFDDTWHFIGTTAGAGTLHGFLDDGTAVVNTYSQGGGFSNTRDLVIGARWNAANQFQGLLDEVRFSDVLRTDAWMNAEYRSQAGLLSAVRFSENRSNLVAEYTHEEADPLRDTTGNGHHAVNAGGGGGVAFVPVVDPQGFEAGLGNTVGSYVRNDSQRLEIPADVVPLGESFTFTALVNKNDLVMGGYRSILASNRFRFQWSTAGTTQEEREDRGRLRIDITGGGGAVAPEGSFDVDTWYFAALTYDATSNSGTAWLQPASPVLAGRAFTFTPTNPLVDLTAFRIGADGLSGIGGTDGWDGLIDNGRFYSGALSKAELRDVLRAYAGLPAGSIGLVAKFDHEGADPLADDTGHGLDLANRGEVTFVAPPAPGDFDLGAAAGEYPRTNNGSLDVPELHTPGDDFTFITMLRKNADETGGHQTILGSNRFRFQFRNTGATDDGAGTLRLDINGAGATGPNESGDGTLLTDEWYYVAMTYDAQTKAIDAYLQPDSPVFLGAAFSRTANDGGLDDMAQFRLGGDGLSGIGGFDAFGGHIDATRFYDQALSRAELREVFRELNPAAAGPVGLLARYDHEAADPLADATGHGVPISNRGDVTFVAPPAPGDFLLGTAVGEYPRTNNGSLDVADLYTAGDDFTFLALVRKNADETGGHQTILGSDRFRFQFRNTGTTDDGAGTLRLDVNGDGATGPGESGDGTFLTDQWYLTALTYDAQTQQINAYLQDGSPLFLGPRFSRTANGAGLDDMTSFRVGGDGLSGIGGFDAWGGHIDEVRFYDQALSTGELRDVFRTLYSGPVGPFGLVAQYDHEGADPLADDTGHGFDLSNRGEVTFVAPPNPGVFQLGGTAGEYPRTGNGSLDVPPVYTPGDGFTFIAMVRKNADETGGHQTILGSDRFRFQFRNTGATDDGAGTLRLDINDAGATGGNESGDGTLLTDEWYFVAMRYDPVTKAVEAFLQDDSPVFLGADISRVANGIGLDDMSQFRIGGDGLSGIGGFDAWGGHIDGERFYDAALTKRELRDVFRTFNPLPGGATTLGLVAEYTHEGADPLTDETGHRVPLVNRGDVTFVAPPGTTALDVGSVVGEYPRTNNGSLDVAQLHTPGDDFTFVALVRKDNDETGGHQTILGSDRFRFQFRNTGATDDGAGTLRLDVNGDGATGGNESGDGTFLVDEWYFTALRYDSSERLIEAFLQDDSSDTLGGPAITRTANGLLGIDDMTAFRVGGDGLSGIGSFDGWSGWLDNVRFYDEYLDDAALQNLFRPTAAAIPEPATLVLLALGLLALPLARRRLRGGR